MERTIKKLFLIIILSFTFITVSCKTLNFYNDTLADYRYEEPRKVIITADDFGASKNINLGIIGGIESGFINTVSAMVTFNEATKDIKKLSEDFPDINIGLHLSISSGSPVSNPQNIPSLVDENGNFYSIDKLILRLDKINLLELKTELKNQITIMQNIGIRIDHLSSQHNILHLYSPFTEVVVDLASNYKLPMRSTMPASVTLDEFSYSKTKIRGQELAANLVKQNPFRAIRFIKYTKKKEMEENQKMMDMYKVTHPAYLIDSYWGNPTSENLFYIFTHLPEGVSEICFHLGVNEEAAESPIGINKNYLLMREFELMSLNNNQIKRWMKILNIEKIGFSEIYQN